MGAAPAPHGSAGRGGGPATWAVLLGTALAAAVVIGGIVAYRAWRDGSDDARAPASTAEPAESTVVAAEPEARLFTRTTASGIEIRVDLRQSSGEELGMGPLDDDAPDFCRIVGELTAFAISPDEIAQTGSIMTAGPPAKLSSTAMWSNTPESGLFGVLAQVGDDAVIARLSAPGSRDEMEPVEGIVALVVDAEDVMGDVDRFEMPVPRNVVLNVRYADGTTKQASGQALLFGPPLWQGDSACFPSFEEVPPPTVDPEDDPFRVRLPPAGAQQPADPAAARAEIVAVLDRLYGADESVDVLALVDDPFAMREMFEQLRQNDAARMFEAVTVDVEDLVFLTAVEAAFDYGWDTPDGVVFDERFGRARLVDGTWRITRGTICNDLRDAWAVTCPS